MKWIGLFYHNCLEFLLCHYGLYLIFIRNYLVVQVKLVFSNSIDTILFQGLQESLKVDDISVVEVWHDDHWLAGLHSQSLEGIVQLLFGAEYHRHWHLALCQSFTLLLFSPFVDMELRVLLLEFADAGRVEFAHLGEVELVQRMLLLEVLDTLCGWHGHRS